MPRNSAAYFCDIIAACNSIDEVLDSVDLGTDSSQRPIRSAVEREFTII